MQNGFARQRYHRCIGERFRARCCAALIERARIVQRIVREALTERVRFSVGREQRENDLAVLDDAEVRPHLAFVEDRLAGLEMPLAHLPCKVADRAGLGRGKRRHVLEERLAFGVLVDAFKTNGPAV